MKLTPELKEIALRVKNNCAAINEVTDFAIKEFAERFLAALPNSEPVATVDINEVVVWLTLKSMAGIDLYAAPPIPQDYKAQLAESQAREAKLREALDAVQQVANRSDGIAGWHLNGDIASWDSILPEVSDALTTPSDATALNELIAKAGEVMQEQCAQRAEQESIGYSSSIAKAIRALPGVTLEDLNHD